MHRLGNQADTIVTPDARSGKQARPSARDLRTGMVRILHFLPHVRRSTAVLLTLVVLVLLITLQADWQPPPDALAQGLHSLTADLRFDLTRWETAAVSGKLQDLIDNPAATLSIEQETTLVRDYLGQARRAGQLESEIERIYGDPEVSDAEEATEGLRAELAQLRGELAQWGPVVEAVLERQVTREIEKAGLETLGLVWPPPKVRFTEPPQLLVVSPRDRIQRLRSVDLEPNLDTAGRAALEEAVSQQHDVSAYVTNIGGYGAYPSMVVDRFGVPWTAETVAHEWVHNYLAFHPLGWSFLQGGEAITINETVASIVGEELGQAVIARYYPDLLPPPTPPPSEVTDSHPPADPPTFNFGQEMRITRLRVDELLAAGQVEEAEAYMEARRQEFVENGYNLRVLNQAYFAFHGSYATGPAATDPIGPKLVRLRELSPSLQRFLRLVDGITSTAELDAALERLEGQPSTQ